MRIIAAPDDAIRSTLDQRTRYRRRVGKAWLNRHPVYPCKLDPAVSVAMSQQIEQLLESRLIDSFLGEKHPHMRERKVALQLLQRRHELARQPAGRQEIELPPELGT